MDYLPLKPLTIRQSKIFSSDGWTEFSCLSCGLTLLPVCHSLYLPASSAKYRGGGGGHSKSNLLGASLKERTYLERGEIHIIGVSVGLLFRIHSFPISNEITPHLGKGMRMWPVKLF